MLLSLRRRTSVQLVTVPARRPTRRRAIREAIASALDVDRDTFDIELGPDLGLVEG